MIRRAEEKDVKRIIELLLQIDLIHHDGRPDLFKVGKKYTEEELFNIIKDENTPVFVYVNQDDKVLGYAICIYKQILNDTLLTDIKTLYLDDLCVDENCRSKGIGKALYEAVVETAKNNGCYNLTLNVWAFNKRAYDFYKKLGFEEQKIGMEIIL